MKQETVEMMQKIIHLNTDRAGYSILMVMSNTGRYGKTAVANCSGHPSNMIVTD
jgi:hypothetical protein